MRLNYSQFRLWLSGAALIALSNSLHAQEAAPEGLEEVIEAQADTIEQLRAEVAELRAMVEAAVLQDRPSQPGEGGADDTNENGPPAGDSDAKPFTPDQIDSVATLEAISQADRGVALSSSTDEIPTSNSVDSSIAISTSTTSSRVAINLNIESGSVTPDEIPSGVGLHTVRTRSISLVASAPIDSDAERSQLFSLSGPEDGFTLGLNARFNQYRFNRVSNEANQTNLERERELIKSFESFAITACVRREVDNVRRTEAQCKDQLSRDFSRLFVTSFDPKTHDDLWAQMDQSQRKAYEDLLAVPKPITLDNGPFLNFGLSGLISYGEFTYFDPVSSALQEDEQRIGFQAGASSSLVFPNDNYSLSASAAFQRNYKASTDQAVCPLEPEEGTTFIACPIRDFGEPMRDDSLLIRGEWRYRLANSFAISPHLVYDALDDEVRVELPIYFIPDDDSGLTGGVRVGYDSEEDDELILGVFVSTPFEF